MSNTQDYSIDHYIKNIRSQMSNFVAYEEEADKPLNQFLQEKYEKSFYSSYHSEPSEFLDNSYSAADYREDSVNRTHSNTLQHKNFPEKSNFEDPSIKIHSLESRINELLKIQDSLMKTLEDNKKLSIKHDQIDKRLIEDLKEKLSIANSRILNLEDLCQNETREKMKKHIKDLENSKGILKKENLNLISKLQEFGKDLQYIELHSKTMNEDIQVLKQQNSALHSEIMALKSEKIENLKKIDLLTNEKNSKDHKISDLQSQISLLEERVFELKNLIQSTSISKLQDLSLNTNNPEINSKLLLLSKENEDLKSQISQRPTYDQIKTAKKKIATLEKFVDSMNLSGTISHKLRSHSYEKKYSQASCLKIIRELMQEANVDNPYGLVEIVRKMRKDNKNSLKSLSFVEKFRDLIVKSSPPNSFNKPPTMKKM